MFVLWGGEGEGEGEGGSGVKRRNFRKRLWLALPAAFPRIHSGTGLPVLSPGNFEEKGWSPIFQRCFFFVSFDNGIFSHNFGGGGGWDWTRMDGFTNGWMDGWMCRIGRGAGCGFDLIEC